MQMTKDGFALQLSSSSPTGLFVCLFNFYTRQQNASRVLAMAWTSVRLSFTLCSPIKAAQTRITKFLLKTATKTLVFGDKILCP